MDTSATKPIGAPSAAAPLSMPALHQTKTFAGAADANSQPIPRHGSGLVSHRVIIFAVQMAADVIGLTLSIVVAGFFAWAISNFVLHADYLAFERDSLQRRMVIWAALATALCVWFAMTGTYSSRRPRQDDVKRLIGALSAILVLDGFVEFASKEHFSRLWIFLVWVTALIVLPITRTAVRKLLDMLGLWRVGVCILGDGAHHAAVERHLMRDSYVGYHVASRLPIDITSTVSISQIASGLQADLKAKRAEIVVLVPNEQQFGELGRIIDALNFSLTPYVLVPPVQRLPFAGLSIQSVVNSDAIIMAPQSGLISPVRRAVKRSFDVVVGTAMLVFFAPLFILITAAIALDGGAPVFGHERIGLAGRPFRCLKFRTMAKDADKILARLLASNPDIAKEWRTNFKLNNDPRITRIGKFLRKSSLDELPQLINVLRGEMSLVGPRPVVAAELSQYYGDDVFYYRLVRPGITGLWQVSGRSGTSYEHRVFLDAWYVRNWDLWTDLVILLNTVPAAVMGVGAY